VATVLNRGFDWIKCLRLTSNWKGGRRNWRRYTGKRAWRRWRRWPGTCASAIRRARSLALEAAPLAAGLPDDARRRLAARFTLVEGEAKWLFGELDAALALADHALAEFDAHDDPIGSADAHWLRTWIEVDRGNSAEGDRALAAAADAAGRAGDPVRRDVFDAAAALFAVFRDLRTARQRWGRHFDARADGLDLAARGWIDDYLGTYAIQASEFGAAISLLMGSFEAAIATGQVRRAVNLATNIGSGFTMLNAHDAATLKTLSATQAQLLEKNVELEQAYEALEEVSLTDQLTGLRNRRFFLQHVDADVGMSLRRYDDPLRQGAGRESAPGKDLVFFMIDLDHFKEVNDRYGHAGGDAVLVQMQERLREVFRESDYLIRWGGEEFLALARATDRDEAKVVAERIRHAVADREFVLPDGTRLHNCSIGFACFPFLPAAPRLLNWSEVVELADQGLYLAKRSGRNAWAAVYSTEATRPAGLFPRLMQHLDQALAGGEVVLVSSLESPAVPAGPKKRRLGLAAGRINS
jgi:diguanylate cyclase (GGDEF)-like protein